MEKELRAQAAATRMIEFVKSKIFLGERDDFLPLWTRATDAQKALDCLPPSWSTLYFDATDIDLPNFFEWVRALLRFEGGTEFAVLALSPDPFSYFYPHFHKYPAFLVRNEHSLDDYYAFLHADPGDSPADALAYNAQEYALHRFQEAGMSWVIEDRKLDGSLPSKGLSISVAGTIRIFLTTRTSFHGCKQDEAAMPKVCMYRDTSICSWKLRR
ncbi:hypothetical protein [Paraburkholderia rhizosphaerae]|nr:hypothetical protein [Paraburkholderia rhizosphaerae]